MAVHSMAGSHRPPIMGSKHVVASGHYLASAAGYRILEQGGNAIDAGVATGIVINVVLPDMTSFGGVAPIIIYSARDEKVETISGLGRWPRSASIEHFVKNRGGDMPPGVERVVVPAAAGAWMTALEEHGTMSFEQVVTPALELALDGFPLHYTGAMAYEGLADVFDKWPSTGDVFAPNGRPVGFGELLVQPALAHTFERLIEVERAAAGRGREGAIAAARDFFYRGEIAQEIVAFVRDGGGFLSLDDMGDFEVGHEPPAVGSFNGYEVYTCGPWCQGPVVAQTIQMLSGDDLRALGHNTPDYIHLLAETLKLAFADRDAFYGDPDHVDVPMTGLLSEEYTRARRGEIDPARAAIGMPSAGDPWRYEGRPAPDEYDYEPATPGGTGGDLDTSYVCCVDRWGNAFSATPSDSLGMSPVVPSLGFTPSGRGTQSWLDERHPSSLKPWKRPRLTPNPAIAFKDGKPWMPFGTPGGDAQCQTMVQVFLNISVFGMHVQQAIEAPRFLTWNFPNSFWPHGYIAGRLQLERGVGSEVAGTLERRGHEIEWRAEYDAVTGGACAIVMDPDNGTRSGGADLRRESYAIGR